MPTIELRETEPIGSNTSIVNLQAVLTAAPDDVRAGNWVAFHWWAIGTGNDLDIGELEARTQEGLALSTAELEAINRQLLQLIDGVIASYDAERPRNTDTDLRSTCRLVIHAVDSTYWRIYAHDPRALDEFRKLGANVTDVKDQRMPPGDPTS